jgi:1-acyl-sn-glycerol-3-phosphate acyltransferase
MKWLVNHIIKILTHILLKVDADELEKFPQQGPLLSVANHINFLDPAVIISHLHPRPTTGLAKKETWDNPFKAVLFNIWGGIPIDRDIADFKAFQLAKTALKEGKILAVAPEGTRTEDGRLVRGKPGVAILALQCEVPILPMAYWGHEHFVKNLKHLKRTPFIIRVGEPFRVNLNGRPKNKETLQAVTDEIMLEIAQLLPEEYRGVYARETYDVPTYLAY